MPSLVGLLSVDLGDDLGFGEAGLGAAVSTFWLVTAVAAPLAGRWIDVHGWPVGARLGALLTGGSLAACALLVDSWLALLAVLAISGLGYAFCSPTSNLLVVAVVPLRRQASVLGFKQTAPPLLMTAAGATLPALAFVHGWRWSVALGLLLPAAVLLGVRRLLATGAPVRSARSARSAGGALPRDSGGSPDPAPAAPLRALPVVVAAGLGTLSVATITGFAVFTLVSVDVAPVRAAGIVAIGSLLAVVARIAAGRYLDSRPVEDLAPLLVVMGLAVLALAMVAAGTFGGAGAGGAVLWSGLVVAGVVLSLVTAWTWPALLLLMVVRRSHGPGAASGLLQLGSGIGSAVGPVGFGLLSGSGNRGWAWLVMTAATVLAMALVARAGGSARADAAVEG